MIVSAVERGEGEEMRGGQRETQRKKATEREREADEREMEEKRARAEKGG